MNVYVCICIWIHASLSLSLYLVLSLSLSLSTCVRVRVCVCACVCLCACMRACVYVYSSCRHTCCRLPKTLMPSICKMASPTLIWPVWQAGPPSAIAATRKWPFDCVTLMPMPHSLSSCRMVGMCMYVYVYISTYIYIYIYIYIYRYRYRYRFR